jgi:hypothetical protein
MPAVANTATRHPSLADFVRSVGVLAGALALAAIVFALVNPDDKPRLPAPVDYQSVLQAARAQFSYDVLAPASVPSGWRATSVNAVQDAEGDRWWLGFLTEDHQFVGLEQADGQIEAYRRERLADFHPDGNTQVGGATWERLIENDRTPDRALVRVEDGALTIVRGTVSYDNLESFVVLLR